MSCGPCGSHEFNMGGFLHTALAKDAVSDGVELDTNWGRSQLGDGVEFGIENGVAVFVWFDFSFRDLVGVSILSFLSFLLGEGSL
jgi:hypothetical protein